MLDLDWIIIMLFWRSNIFLFIMRILVTMDSRVTCLDTVTLTVNVVCPHSTPNSDDEYAVVKPYCMCCYTVYHFFVWLHTLHTFWLYRYINTNKFYNGLKPHNISFKSRISCSLLISLWLKCLGQLISTHFLKGSILGLSVSN